MPKTPRASALPKLDFSEDPLKELRVNVRGSVHVLIARYAEFVERTRGQKADKNKVVDGGLEVFFAEDVGFQKFLKDGGAKPAVSAAPSTAGPSATEP
jgi:hypothetical protein